MALNSDQLKYFAKFIEEKLGIVYSKDNFYQLEKRLHDIAIQLEMDSAEELWKKAQGGIFGQMKLLLLDQATNNETSFFRDASLFKVIEDKILTDPRFSGDSPHPLRIWCCATSTGQEVYTMAIILNAWQRHNPKRAFTFYATDYSQRVLAQAEMGRYSQLEIQRGLPATMVNRFFHSDSGSGTISSQNAFWVVNEDLKKNITFKQQNLLEDFGYIGPFDIVMCRNVLIYQNVENKRKIIAEISKKMSSDGYFIMGAAESLTGLSDEFDLLQFDRSVVYQKKRLSSKQVS